MSDDIGREFINLGIKTKEYISSWEYTPKETPRQKGLYQQRRELIEQQIELDLLFMKLYILLTCIAILFFILYLVSYIKE
jgi:hypothetical protein